MKNKIREHKLNSEITVSEVRIPDEGILSTSKALRIAESKGLDLVLINDKSNPPIAKIMNYEKFIYEQKKKPVNKTPDLKEIKLGHSMSENDLSYRVKHIQEFLAKGHRVKLSMRFTGLAWKNLDQHLERGQKIMLKLIMDVDDYGIPESVPKMDGKLLISFIRPKNKK